MNTPTVRLLVRALDGARETAPGDADRTITPDATHGRILDAALELAAAGGMRSLTMDDVAARAGVGRMTVYRRFGTRATLIDELTVREGRRCLAEIAGAVNSKDPFEERVAALFVATLRVISEHPLLARLARVEPEAILRELTRNDSEVFQQVRAFLVAQVRQAQLTGELAVGDPEPVAELALRLGASFVLIPGGVFSGAEEERVRDTLRTLLTTKARRKSPGSPRR